MTTRVQFGADRPQNFVLTLFSSLGRDERSIIDCSLGTDLWKALLHTRMLRRTMPRKFDLRWKGVHGCVPNGLAQLYSVSQATGRLFRWREGRSLYLQLVGWLSPPLPEKISTR